MDSIIAVLLALAAATATAPPEAIGSFSVETSARDYPIEALRLQQEGETTVELRIDRKGRVKECAVLVSSGSLYLDAGTCKVMMDKGRFDFAKGGRPKAGPSVISQRLAWRLPR